MRADRCKEQLIAEDFDRTGSRARAAADQADEKEQRHGEAAPFHIIRRRIAGARDDGGDVKDRFPQDPLGLVGRAAAQDEKDNHHQKGQGHEKAAHLRVAVQGHGVAVDKLHVAHERQGREDHEDRRDIFGGAREGAERGIVVGEPPGRHRGQRMNRRVEGAHPERKIAQHTSQRQPEVNHGNLRRDLPRAGQDFTKGVKGFGFEDLHTTDPQLGQEHHGDDDDTDAAQPLQNTAPDQQPLGQVFQSGQHRGPGGRQPRHRLKHRVGDAGIGRAQHEGQGPEQWQHQPNAGGEHKCLLDGEPFADPVGAGKGDHTAAQRGDQRTFDEDPPLAPALGQIDQDRDDHGKAKHGH